MRRRIVQIALAQSCDSEDDHVENLHVLDEHGIIWWWQPTGTGGEWRSMPELPEEAEPPAAAEASQAPAFPELPAFTLKTIAREWYRSRAKVPIDEDGVLVDVADAFDLVLTVYKRLREAAGKVD